MFNKKLVTQKQGGTLEAAFLKLRHFGGARVEVILRQQALKPKAAIGAKTLNESSRLVSK